MGLSIGPFGLVFASPKCMHCKKEIILGQKFFIAFKNEQYIGLIHTHNCLADYIGSTK